MKLRLKLILYLVFIHIVFAVTAYFVFLENRLWIFAMEGFFLLSFITGWTLIRSMFKPLELIVTGSGLIDEGDFTSTFRGTGQPEMDKLISLYNEMVDRLRNERLKLEEQHLFLHKLVQASPSGVIILDYDERIQMVNPSAERLLELSNRELIHKTLKEIETPFTNALDRLTIDESLVVPFKGNRRMKCSKSQFLDQGFQRHFIIIEELTEAIRRSEKSAYEKLIRLLSHEVNNSVGAVNSLLQSCLFYKDQIGDEDREDFETAVNVSISRLGNLNQFMRSYADIVRLPEPTLNKCRIEELTRNCAELFRKESEDKRISWQWGLDEKIPPILADKSQMEQVFVNILKNAMEAIDTEGIITVKTGDSGGNYYIVIEDTGPGISDEVQQNLFAPFFSTKDNGQGIGLTLVQEILNRHQFEFSLESKPGGPTQFTIWF
jgi:nitrogen fixation/metabolism regulation signal transduction histidine kinase